MSFMTTREAATRWGYTEETVRKWCKAGLLYSIKKAEKKNGRWLIPADAECPKQLKKERIK